MKEGGESGGGVHDNAVSGGESNDIINGLKTVGGLIVKKLGGL
jgi:hypothetical protein